MKIREIINYIIALLVVISLGYVIYVQSKEGIRVYGSENVIDPFQYESVIFENKYSGINPNSSANHLTSEEFQSRKFNKMKDLLIITIPIILLLSIINSQKKNESNESDNIIEPSKLSDDEQLRLSFLEMAIKMECLPDDVKNNYIKEIIINDFKESDLIETENAWKNKKDEDAEILGINPENTPAALMERWTREYRISKIKK